MGLLYAMLIINNNEYMHSFVLVYSVIVIDGLGLFNPQSNEINRTCILLFYQLAFQRIIERVKAEIVPGFDAVMQQDD